MTPALPGQADLLPDLFLNQEKTVVFEGAEPAQNRYNT